MLLYFNAIHSYLSVLFFFCQYLLYTNRSCFLFSLIFVSCAQRPLSHASTSLVSSPSPCSSLSPLHLTYSSSSLVSSHEFDLSSFNFPFLLLLFLVRHHFPPLILLSSPLLSPLLLCSSVKSPVHFVHQPPLLSSPFLSSQVLIFSSSPPLLSPSCM